MRSLSVILPDLLLFPEAAVDEDLFHPLRKVLKLVARQALVVFLLLHIYFTLQT